MLEILKELVSDIDATGGLVMYTDGIYAPIEHPNWTDLGMTVKKAYDELKRNNIDITLSIDKLTTSSKDIF